MSSKLRVHYPICASTFSTPSCFSSLPSSSNQFFTSKYHFIITCCFSLQHHSAIICCHYLQHLSSRTLFTFYLHLKHFRGFHISICIYMIVSPCCGYLQHLRSCNIAAWNYPNLGSFVANNNVLRLLLISPYIVVNGVRVCLLLLFTKL